MKFKSNEIELELVSLKGSAVQLKSKSGYYKHKLNGFFRECSFGQERLISIDCNATLTNSLTNPLPNKSLVYL